MDLNYMIWRDAFVVAVATTVLLVTYVVAGAPTRQPSRLGTRGLKRGRAIAEGGLFAQLEPLVRWLGVRVSGLLSEDARMKLEKQLRIAGYFLGLTAEELAGLILLGTLGGALFGVVGGLALGNARLILLFAVPLGAGAPLLAVSGEGTRRMLRIRHGLPHAIDLMTLSMSAGLDFPGAVRQVIEKSTDPRDPVIEEFHHVLSGLHLGSTRKQALIELGERAPIDSVMEFVSAIVQAEDRGNPLAQVLAVQADTLRRRRSTGAEEAAARAGVAMAGPLFLLFGAIMIIIMAPMALKLSRGL